MNLRITASTNIEDICVDKIEYINNKGFTIPVEWEQHPIYAYNGGHGMSFTGVYKNIYFGGHRTPLPFGGMEDILTLSAINVYVRNKNGKMDDDVFICRSVEFYDEKGGHYFSNDKINDIIYI